MSLLLFVNVVAITLVNGVVSTIAKSAATIVATLFLQFANLAITVINFVLTFANDQVIAVVVVVTVANVVTTVVDETTAANALATTTANSYCLKTLWSL